jgi:aspartate 4-decarboxylase
MKKSMEKKYDALSPFELKNELIRLAQHQSEKLMLNAGRGNPNWLAVTPREAFFLFGHFALEESKRTYVVKPEFGQSPEKTGVKKRFLSFLRQHKAFKSTKFLKKALDYVEHELKINGDDFLFEMVDAILGDHYPTPDRVLTNVEKIVRRYLIREMCGGKRQRFYEKLDLFVTEGGTAAMTYVFNSLMENKILHKGDTIALGTPIFTPYLEIPHISDYKFCEIEVKQDENLHWQYTDAELKKLENPKIKAFFIVNPSNPTSVSIGQKSLRKIAKLVETKRRDLIILTDDVYGTFVNDFRSLVAIAPKNTILVYSFSKYFGATGWRLGVIGIHSNNILDKKIANLSEKDKKALHKRFSTIVLDPSKMKFIDRLVADSRAVALNHTAGLSTPQQVMMTFFSLFCLVDQLGKYKATAQKIVKRRIEKLYTALKLPCPSTPYDANYYSTIDLRIMAETHYGKAFAQHLASAYNPIDFVMRLAKEKGIVLLNGGGFDAPNMSVRVSLANLPSNAYQRIGEQVFKLLREYYEEWKKNNK